MGLALGKRPRNLSVTWKVALGAGAVLLAAALVFLGFFFAYLAASGGPVRVGVLLPATGRHAQGDREAIAWAAERVNRGGGIGGRRIEVVFTDTGDAHTGAQLKKLAAPLLADGSLTAVIGPWNSEGMMALAPLFIKKKKLLISPSATSDEIFRAFAGTHYPWRTCESDIAQVRTILHVLKSRGVGKLSLVSESGVYGETFHNWAPFYAREMGIEICALPEYERADPDIRRVLDLALQGAPEYVICASFVEDAVKIKKELDARGGPARMLVTDAAVSKALPAMLGPAAAGIEYVIPSDDPASGYEKQYAGRFGSGPLRSNCASYDALLLAAYTAARQQYANGGFRKYVFGGGEDAFESMWMVANGNVLQVDEAGRNVSVKVAWDRPAEAISLFLRGKSPDVSGASGPLEYDWIKGVDPLHTFYAYGVTEIGARGPEFRTSSVLSSDDSLGAGVLPEGASAGRTTASGSYRQEFTDEAAGISFPAREGMKAVIIATSGGWENYRHQADALGLYHKLKENGVKDEDIILMTADDLAENPANRMKGDVHWVKGGPNVREGARIDYSGDRVTAGNLVKVLEGEKSQGASAVLESGPGTDVLLYLIGHGSPGRVMFRYGESLSSDGLASTIGKMRAAGRFRRMLVIEDTCYGESVGAAINAEGVAYLCASSIDESAYGCEYDEKIDAWLSEEFSFSLLSALGGDGGLTLDELYNTLYKEVPGSHVTMLNYQTFGSVSRTPVVEFTAP